MVIGNHVSGQSNLIFPCDHHIFHHISPLQKPRKFSLHACEKSWRWAYDVIKWLIRQKIVLNPFYIRNLSKKEKSLLPYKSWKMIRSGCILNHQLSFGIINDLLHERSGPRYYIVWRFITPRKIVFPLGFALGKYDFPWRNKSSYFPRNHAINV